ncbi:MAG: hypothetical protein FWE73_01170 [Candidatus Bathyarchaeota archaeon]|nr:hypothetical protein [Candidatus Termitimicrobium sp.]
MMGKEPNVLRYKFDEDRDEAEGIFFYRVESIDAPVKSIAEMQGRSAQSQEKRRKLRTWIAHEKQLDREIEQLEHEIRIAKRDFKENFGIEPEEAPAEIECIREQIRENEHANNIRNARISELTELQEAIELEYKTQMLPFDLLPDKEEMYRLLEDLEELTKDTDEKQIYNETKSLINTITDETFKKSIAKLPIEQVQVLIKACKTKGKHNL